jgi:hypothetical protein
MLQRLCMNTTGRELFSPSIVLAPWPLDPLTSGSGYIRLAPFATLSLFSTRGFPIVIWRAKPLGGRYRR